MHENKELQATVHELTNQLDIVVNPDSQLLPENQQLRDRITELEAEKAELSPIDISAAELLTTPDYEQIRDFVLAKLKMGRQSAAGKAINAFIKELGKDNF